MDTQPITQTDHMLPEGEYAGFFRRLAAIIIDGLILGTIGRWIGTLFFSPEDLRISAFATLIGWLYFAFMESSKFQGTIGKLALKIKVTDLEGKRISFLRATGRHFAKFLSAIILGLGYLMVIWTDRKQGLHDMIAKTLVVRK